MRSLSSQRDHLMKTRAVAEWLGVSVRTLRLWAECGEVRAIKVGSHWRFQRSDVTEWLEKRNPDRVR